jgi:transcriptional regulator with XRE-family HTH domain
LKNTDRRHYQKIITKEVRVLKNFRKMRNLSQDEASSLCGYSRATIGHIENGRIELNKERIGHISMCYGFTYSDFEKHFGITNLREESIEYCSRNLKSLSDEKLNLIRTMIDSLSGN